MKTGAGIAVGLAVTLAAGGGYWFGQRPMASHGAPAASVAAVPAEGAKKERKLLYYRNPMGLPDTSPTPKKDPMGMDYIPVYEGEADETPASSEPRSGVRARFEVPQDLLDRGETGPRSNVTKTG